MNEISYTINELHRIFNLLNKYRFDGVLPDPTIIIQTSGRKKNVMGWCSHEKLWQDKEHEVKKYEITICAEYLNYPIIEIMDTLVHEMVHLYNQVCNVKDCSRSKGYHNNKFKKKAEEIGLIVTYNTKTGWGSTKLGQELIELINTFNINGSVFNLARYSKDVVSINDIEDVEENNSENKPKKKKGMLKYVCPSCTTIIRATKEVNVICGKCKETFIIDEPIEMNNR